MPIEMGVIDRPEIKTETVDDTKIKVTNKIKRIEDIVVPLYPFRDINWRDGSLYSWDIKNDLKIEVLNQFIRIEINSSNYQDIRDSYRRWNNRVRSLTDWNVYINRIYRYDLGRLCTDFGIDMRHTRDIDGNKITFYNPKYKSSERITCYQTNPVFRFILKHVKQNLDEYKQLVELYNYEVAINKELATWKDEIITCLDESIEEYKDKLIEKYKEENFK